MFHRMGFAILSLLLSSPVLAQDGIDERINQAVKPFADSVAGFVFSSFPVAGVQIPFVLVWLIAAATFFTFYFRFVNGYVLAGSTDKVNGDGVFLIAPNGTVQVITDQVTILTSLTRNDLIFDPPGDDPAFEELALQSVRFFGVPSES